MTIDHCPLLVLPIIPCFPWFHGFSRSHGLVSCSCLASWHLWQLPGAMVLTPIGSGRCQGPKPGVPGAPPEDPLCTPRCTPGVPPVYALPEVHFSILDLIATASDEWIGEFRIRDV